MIKALIFDFDGVLVSSELPRMRAVQELLSSRGITIADSIRVQAPGKTTRSILEQVVPDNPDLVEQLILEYRSNYVQDITNFVEPIGFTVDFIRDYKGEIPIAIASMSSLDAIKQLTMHFGIFDKIALIVSRSEVREFKPHPEVYLKTAEGLNVKPGECMVFEDTPLGVKAALDAGMQCCVILNGSNTKRDLEGFAVSRFISNGMELLNVLSE